MIFNPYSPIPDVSEWKVFVGPQIVDGVEVFETSVAVDRIIFSNLPGINIALLKLAKPVNYKDYIQPVCMDINNARSFPTGTSCWVAGWEKESVMTGMVLVHFLNHFFFFLKNVFMCAPWTFYAADKPLSGLQDLDTQVASCRNVSDSDHICTNTMNLHLVNLSPQSLFEYSAW